MPQRHMKRVCGHNRVILFCGGVYKINGCQHKMVVCLCGCVCHPQASDFTHTTGMVIQCRQWVREDARPCMHTQPTSCMCTSSQPAHFEQSPNHRPKSQTLPVFTQKIPTNFYHVLTSLCCHLHCFSGVFFGFLLDEDKALAKCNTQLSVSRAGSMLSLSASGTGGSHVRLRVDTFRTFLWHTHTHARSALHTTTT